MFNLFSWQEEHLTIVSGRLGGIIALLSFALTYLVKKQWAWPVAFV